MEGKKQKKHIKKRGEYKPGIGDIKHKKRGKYEEGEQMMDDIPEEILEHGIADWGKEENEEDWEDEEFVEESEESEESDPFEQPIPKNKQPKYVEESKILAKINKKTENKGELIFENSAYEMLHRSTLEWSCLSLDFVVPERCLYKYEFYNSYRELRNSQEVNKDRDINDKYPYNIYMISGSQTATAKENKLYVMGWEGMHKTLNDDGEDSENEHEDDWGQSPKLNYKYISHPGAINRIRAMNSSNIVATWSELGTISIYNIAPMINHITQEFGSSNTTQKTTQLHSKYNKSCRLSAFQNKREGFALDWSSLSQGKLATGGCDSNIYIYIPGDNFTYWERGPQPLCGHKGSVEDIQFSPTEDFVLASCGVDQTIKIWDLREKSTNPPTYSWKAHENDINALSWNNICTYLLASGSDDYSFKVWDLRYLKYDPITHIKWHSSPITSLQFQPRSESVLAVASEDNKLTIWDFAVEEDLPAEEMEGDEQIPSQLMFVHQGQKDIKEIRY